VGDGVGECLQFGDDPFQRGGAFGHVFLQAQILLVEFLLSDGQFAVGLFAVVACISNSTPR
jgi:hypothetical protein